MNRRGNNGDAMLPLARRVLARNVARRRESAGYTFEGLGAASGLHWRHVQKLEFGEINATLRTLCRLAVALGCTLPELLMDDA